MSYALGRRSKVFAYVLLAVVTAAIVVVGYCCWIAFYILRYFAATGGDYSLALPRGYSLVRTSSECVSLCSPDKRAVLGPTITGYHVAGPIVTGYMRALDEPGWVKGKSGYFLLDTRTGAVKSWTQQQQWLAAARKRGVVPLPLQRPQRPE